MFELVEKSNIKRWWLVAESGIFIGKIFETFHPSCSYEAFTPEPECHSKRVFTLDEGKQFLLEQHQAKN